MLTNKALGRYYKTSKITINSREAICSEESKYDSNYTLEDTNLRY